MSVFHKIDKFTDRWPWMGISLVLIYLLFTPFALVAETIFLIIAPMAFFVFLKYYLLFTILLGLYWGICLNQR